MMHLFTLDELERMEYACHLSGRDHDLAAKVRSLVDNEYRIGYSRNPRMAVTPAELVKQMILDSPLARVPDTAQPLNVVNIAIALPYLRRLIEAVEAL